MIIYRLWPENDYLGTSAGADRTIRTKELQYGELVLESMLKSCNSLHLVDVLDSFYVRGSGQWGRKAQGGCLWGYGGGGG